MRILTLITGLAIAFAAPLNAASIPASGQLNFDVVRKGKDIGDHSYRFSGSPGSFSVTVSTDVIVRVPLIRIAAYRFEHSSVETWRGGELQTLVSTTNDDGTPHELNTGNQGPLPASLWNDDIVRSGQLMNTIDGTIMSVRVADLGSENVPVNGGNLNTHHYRISGGLERDLWYDENGNLARVAFKAEDGSTVTYIRK